MFELVNFFMNFFSALLFFFFFKTYFVNYGCYKLDNCFLVHSILKKTKNKQTWNRKLHVLKLLLLVKLLFVWLHQTHASTLRYCQLNFFIIFLFWWKFIILESTTSAVNFTSLGFFFFFLFHFYIVLKTSHCISAFISTNTWFIH